MGADRANDLEIEIISALWVELSKAVWACPSTESLTERLLAKPWMSADPQVKAAWQRLTDPKNLHALEKWANMGPMNPTARETTLEALRSCKARAHA